MFKSLHHRNASLAISMSFSLLLFHSNMPAQSVARPERGASKVETSDQTEVDRIDLRNGNLSIAIPLASLPPISGGRLGYTLYAHYNSKLWNSYLREEFFPGSPDYEETGPPTFYTAEVPTLSATGGWRIGERYSLVSESASEDYVRSSARSSANDSDHAEITNNSWHKSVLLTPDGSRHELRPFGFSTFGGSNDFYRGYYKVSPALLGQPIDYYSFDGSFLRVRVFPHEDRLAWRVLHPDGTMIEQFRDGVQRISDTNDNAILILDDGASRIFKEERTGREVILRKEGNDAYEVTYRTVGGGFAAVRINLKRSLVSKLFAIQVPASETNPNGPCVIHERVVAEIGNVEKIEFPSTEMGKSGSTYTFDYKDVETVSDSLIPACGQGAILVDGITKGAGELSEMKVPSGAVYRYEYHLDGRTKTGENPNTTLAANTVSKRTIAHDRTLTVWNYSFGVEQSAIANPDGTNTVIERYPSWLSSGLNDEGGLSGLVYRETIGNHLKIERRWKRLVFSGANDKSAEVLLPFNPVIAEEYKTIYAATGEPIKTSATVFEHDFNGNVLSSTTYDWFATNLLERDVRGIPLKIPQEAPLISKTESSYHHSPKTADSDAIYHLNSSRIISTKSAFRSGPSIEEFAYDGLRYSSPPEEGNLSAKRIWSDTESSWIEYLFEHDSYGNVVREVDPAGIAVDYEYADTAKSNPTAVIRKGDGTSVELIERYVFDFHTGRLLSATDANGHQSSIEYQNHLLGDIDPFGRPGVEMKPLVTVRGNPMAHRTNYSYEDSFNRTTIESDAASDGDRGRKTRETKDAQGRTILIERNEAGESEFTISSRLIHSSDGSSILTENPRRVAKAATDGWTRIVRDPIGRTTQISSVSGRRVPVLRDGITPASENVIHSYDAETVTIIDQAGKWTRRYTDALGRLSRIDEPGNNETSPTFYRYDSRGNLIRIEQGDDVRTFEYDSLSRLKSESSPESGVSHYRYDSRGNRVEKRDGNGTKTKYSYDALGRLRRISYEVTSVSEVVPTADVNFFYDDPAVPNSKGRLTAVVTEESERYIERYDEVGRILEERLIRHGKEFRIFYEYSLSGQLIETTLPSGRRVSNHIDSSGDVRSVSIHGHKDFGPSGIVSDITYHPSATLAAMKLGNNVVETQILNSRLQPIRISLRHLNAADEIFSLENIFRPSLRSAPTGNNGNIHKQLVSRGQSKEEHLFKYDQLNRISMFRMQKNDGVSSEMTYRYDRNGNMLHECDGSARTTCSESSEPSGKLSKGEIEKRDSAGNLVVIGKNERNVFDAENRLVRVTASDGTLLARYAYDGEGRRISKTVLLNNIPDEVTLYIHDASGRVLAEYSSKTPSAPAGRRLFLTSDHLGSVRAVTGLNGVLLSTNNYTPFGEKISKTETEDITNRFAGHDRDVETGFIHAEARTFSPEHGRFLSADPITIAPDRLRDPQRLNRFSYVRNSPLRFSDPSGEDLYIKITNIVIGYQYLVDVSSGKRIRIEVMSYRVVVTNDSGTRRIFELTRGSSHGERGQYARLQEAPPGEYTGRIRQDGRRGFRVELTEPGQPDGQMTTPDSPRNRGNIQLHRNGLYVEGCMTFPKSDYDRFQETITGMLEQDRVGGFGTKIFVSLTPRNSREGSGDLFPGDKRISDSDMFGDRDGTASKNKVVFNGVIPPSPKRLQ